jgi:hypothetical protein
MGEKMRKKPGSGSFKHSVNIGNKKETKKEGVA